MVVRLLKSSLMNVFGTSSAFYFKTRWYTFISFNLPSHLPNMQKRTTMPWSRPSGASRASWSGSSQDISKVNAIDLRERTFFAPPLLELLKMHYSSEFWFRIFAPALLELLKTALLSDESAGACLLTMYLAFGLFRLYFGILNFWDFVMLFDTNELLIHIRSRLFFHPTATVPGHPLQLFSSTIIGEFGCLVRLFTGVHYYRLFTTVFISSTWPFVLVEFLWAAEAIAYLKRCWAGQCEFQVKRVRVVVCFNRQSLANHFWEIEWKSVGVRQFMYFIFWWKKLVKFTLCFSIFFYFCPFPATLKNTI